MSRRTSSRLGARDLALVANFTAIVAALGLIPAAYPFGTTVPITAQSLGVMLAGAVLGRWRGAAAIVLLLVLVAVGLPLLSGGRGGLGVFAGPSVGYLFGWVAAAWVTGWITERGGSPYRIGWGLVANVVGGIVVLYALGIPGTAWRAGISIQAAAVGSGLFIVGDLAKAVIAAFVARGVHAAYPELLGGTRRSNGSKQGAAV